ncbi:MAG: TldD/PmbA family protein [Candidatus Latescibacterota bacterium]
MMDRTAAQRILEQVMTHSESDETEAALSSCDSALTRFAESVIHQNVAEHDVGLTVRAIVGQRIGAASTNRLDEESLRRVVRDAAEIARFAPEDAALLPRIGPQRYQEANAYDTGTDPASYGPEARASAVSDAIGQAGKNGLTAAGAFSNEAKSIAVANSKGAFAYHCGTSANFSMTAMAADSSGWAEGEARALSEIDPGRVGQIAIEKALASQKPRAIEPGTYPVILEPAAVEGIVGWMMLSFNALEVAEGRSFLTGRVGTQIAGESITLSSDPYHPLHRGAPFDGEGMPKRRLTLIEQGIAKDLACDRVTAKKSGVAATGHSAGGRSANGAWPSHLVLEGGDATVEEMIRSTKRGILVTRFWYENILDRMKLIITGMTRDGLFWIEDGKVQYPIQNFRFNQSVPEFLNCVEMMSSPVLVAGMAAPAMKVRRFHFTSGTAF